MNNIIKNSFDNGHNCSDEQTSDQKNTGAEMLTLMVKHNHPVFKLEINLENNKMSSKLPGNSVPIIGLKQANPP